MTMLAVSISAENEEAFLRQLELAVSQGAEAVELRVDALANPDTGTVLRLIKSVKSADVPVIMTCRDVSEGGLRDVKFSHRLELYRKAIEANADFVDIEFNAFKHPDVHSVIKAAMELSPTRLILSAHNFTGPFEDPQVLCESILSLYPKAIPKIVFLAKHVNDCFAVYDVLAAAESPVIAFCMGAAGQVSRILAKKLGAAISYASLDDTNRTAPGQISLGDMKKVYRWDAINTETEVFGLLGNPVGHSLSPLLFNRCFEEHGINAVYLPFLLEGDQVEFSLFMEQVRRYNSMNFGGFSVTIPHKPNALNYTRQQGDYLEPLAVTIGSVNTVKIGFNGIISAYNTDYLGAMEALKQAIGPHKHGLHQTSVAIVGAGGVARAVAAGLSDAGAKITIYNRTLSRAQMLANEFMCKAEDMEAIRSTDARILVNCTSIGMYPNMGVSPVPESVLRKDMVVFDTVYNPLETELLKQARKAGAEVINGAEMFIRQAMAQYKIFIGQDPDEDLMRQIVYAGLQQKEEA